MLGTDPLASPVAAERLGRAANPPALAEALARVARRILGCEWACDLDAVGSAVRELAVGDRVFGATSRFGAADVQFLAELVERGDFRPVVDGTYALDEVVEGTKYVETGQKIGNVVLALTGGGAR
jgi:NADPH:quinone reductase-like Zn-dependent oxidoreductase